MRDVNRLVLSLLSRHHDFMRNPRNGLPLTPTTMWWAVALSEFDNVPDEVKGGATDREIAELVKSAGAKGRNGADVLAAMMRDGEAAGIGVDSRVLMDPRQIGSLVASMKREQQQIEKETGATGRRAQLKYLLQRVLPLLGEEDPAFADFLARVPGLLSGVEKNQSATLFGGVAGIRTSLSEARRLLVSLKDRLDEAGEGEDQSGDEDEPGDDARL
jgi:hypothetical protein